MKRFGSFLAIAATAAMAACGGGVSTQPQVAPVAAAAPVATATPAGTVTPVATAAPTAPGTATPQVITLSLPGSAIGTVIDPLYGLISGYTQQTFSQTLGFVPGAQVMIRNGQTAIPHTLNVLSQTAFPVSPALSTTASGGTTVGASFASGSISPDTTIGPFTLTAGLYFIGCGFHYLSSSMRTVLNVAAAATPGPQATPVPSAAAPVGGFGY